MLKYICLVFVLIFWVDSYAEERKPREVTVTGTTVFYVDENTSMSLGEAKIKAFEQAKQEAIREEFGQLVIDETILNITEDKSWINSVVLAKGMWLGDIKPAELSIEYVDGHLIFKPIVHGVIREIIKSDIDMKWSIRKNAPNGDETNKFRNNDIFYVNFQSPIDGYVALYSVDVKKDVAQCLIPYRNNSDFRVKAGHKYTFFDPDSDPDCYARLKLTTSSEIEYDKFVLVFSKNPFARPMDSANMGQSQLRRSSAMEFQKWLLQCLRLDADMVTKDEWITIVNDK